MSTRSRVGVSDGNKITSIYVHSDGYLSYLGELLQSHYTDGDKVAELISLGDASFLTPLLHPKDGCESSFFYKRDRFEDNCEAEVSDSFDEFLTLVSNTSGEFYYVMMNGIWFAGSPHYQRGLKRNGVVKLADALEDIKLGNS